jgi:hypothetical protein
MAGTLMTFSYVVLKGLRELGVTVEQDEEEAYLHAWNVVGHVMGIHETFLRNATTMAEAESLSTAVITRNRSRNAVEARPGRLLTRSLMQFMEELIWPRIVWLGPLDPARRIPRILTRVLIGAESADLLGVKWTWGDSLAWEVLRRWRSRLGGLATTLGNRHEELAEWLFRQMMESLWQRPRGGRRKPFDIPEHLATVWGLQPRPQARVVGARRRPGKTATRGPAA